MATRLYPSSTTPDVTASGSINTTGWDAGSFGAAPRAMFREKTNRYGTTGGSGTIGTGTSGQFKAITSCVSEPLAAQTISGTFKGQVFCNQTNITDNYTLAVAIRVINSSGADRGVLLSVVASDDTSTTPPEMATTKTVRRILNSAESASHTLSSLAVQDGDRIVIELGFRTGSTSTATASVTPQNDYTADDVAENDTATTGASWFEFSQDLNFQQPSIGKKVTLPATTGGSQAATQNTITPPSMPTGSLVVVVCQSRASTTWSVGVTGGQTWTSENAIAVTANVFVRVFWCTFNGTWSANPRFDSTSGTATSVAMFTIEGATTSDTWAVDVAQASTNHAAASPITRTGVTTVANKVFALAGFFSADDNSWSYSSGTGWYTILSLNNLASTDQSMGIAYTYEATGGTATGDVAYSQASNGNDATTSWIMAFANSTPATATSFIFNPFPFQPFLVR